MHVLQARQLGPVEPQREQLNLERISIVVDLLNNFPTRALTDRLPTDMPADSVRAALQAVPGVMAATILDLDAAGAPLAVAASAAVDASSAVRPVTSPPHLVVRRRMRPPVYALRVPGLALRNVCGLRATRSYVVVWSDSLCACLRSGGRR